MSELSACSEKEWDAVIIGGGCTGAGVLRDLSMRGLKVLLLEQGDMVHGSSSCFHGLLHSGARYAVKDSDAARECIRENAILKKIGKYCIEKTEGFFVALPEDDPAYESDWVRACEECGIRAEPLVRRLALQMEPNLTEGFRSVYRVPDSAVDGFRLVWQNVFSAQRHGGVFRTRTKIGGLLLQNGRVCGVRAQDTGTGESAEIRSAFVVNATGSWVDGIARMAGLRVRVQPDRGALISFNHRFTTRVVNRLHPSGDGDIFVPHGSSVIFGTTSAATDDPGDSRVTTTEARYLLDIGRKLFPRLDQYRILRVFAGTRPLYLGSSDSGGREVPRNFIVLDHENEGMPGILSVCGGKFTTYRLMAEKVSDLVCEKLSCSARCATAEEPLIPDIDEPLKKRAAVFFPKQGLETAISRLGDRLESVVSAMEAEPRKKDLVCECEMVTAGEFDLVAGEDSTTSLNDIRRRTRCGMGTCQGTFCGIRALGRVYEHGLLGSRDGHHAAELLKDFQNERWGGFRSVLWGGELKELELSRYIYSATLNLEGSGFAEEC
ncbi:MAG: anaerobic glycerol-3-phosphate dehydrogenase subunit A [Mailhella sp.]|nr:anaerobic glycerol-3-phosphate dehydrogenase subunit A [Mailhella sp.]